MILSTFLFNLQFIYSSERYISNVENNEFINLYESLDVDVDVERVRICCAAAASYPDDGDRAMQALSNVHEPVRELRRQQTLAMQRLHARQ